MAVKLRVPLSDNLGYVPPVLGYLATVTQFTEGFRHYRVRHPGGIFNLQLGDFATNLLSLTQSVNSESLFNSEPEANGDLIRKLVATLFAFSNYYNAAYDIILGCCKPEDSGPVVDTWKWPKEHGYKAEGVYKSGLSEAKFFLDIFNELKHSSKMFGTVVLTRLSGKVKACGYYLESVDETGAIIPDSKYHGDERGARFASSFNRDLRWLYCLLYKIADVLAEVLKQHFLEVYSAELSFDAEHHEDGALLEKLFHVVESLPLVFLPNEARKTVPTPRLTLRPTNKFLLFDNYRIPNGQEARGAYDVQVLLPRPDGFSRSWGLPYHRRA